MSRPQSAEAITAILALGVSSSRPSSGRISLPTRSRPSTGHKPTPTGLPGSALGGTPLGSQPLLSPDHPTTTTTGVAAPPTTVRVDTVESALLTRRLGLQGCDLLVHTGKQLLGSRRAPASADVRRRKEHLHHLLADVDPLTARQDLEDKGLFSRKVTLKQLGIELEVARGKQTFAFEPSKETKVETGLLGCRAPSSLRPPSAPTVFRANQNSNTDSLVQKLQSINARQTASSAMLREVPPSVLERTPYLLHLSLGDEPTVVESTARVAHSDRPPSAVKLREAIDASTKLKQATEEQLFRSWSTYLHSIDAFRKQNNEPPLSEGDMKSLFAEFVKRSSADDAVGGFLPNDVEEPPEAEVAPAVPSNNPLEDLVAPSSSSLEVLNTPKMMFDVCDKAAHLQQLLRRSWESQQQQQQSATTNIGGGGMTNSYVPLVIPKAVVSGPIPTVDVGRAVDISPKVEEKRNTIFSYPAVPYPPPPPPTGSSDHHPHVRRHDNSDPPSAAQKTSEKRNRIRSAEILVSRQRQAQRVIADQISSMQRQKETQVERLHDRQKTYTANLYRKMCHAGHTAASGSTKKPDPVLPGLQASGTGVVALPRVSA